MRQDSPPGQSRDTPDTYSPDLLFAISRADSRALLGLADELPFHGVDIWNAWELTWLNEQGRPSIAALEIRVPADSPRLIESKSLKLYLNSFSMSRFATVSDVETRIRRDLGNCVGAQIAVSLASPAASEGGPTDLLPGTCIDALEVECEHWEVRPELLRADARSPVSEQLHSHVLRSLCPVTSQPDTGSILIGYTGPKIDAVSLLQYIVSFRRHSDFHEACIERIFLDLVARCAVEKLSIIACYQRRGGIDINPFRSNFEADPPRLRLWRQ